MKTIIVLISLLFSLPAAGYEVIFHQGFEGGQFPPEGWEAYGEVEHHSPGYDSEWCARLIGSVFYYTTLTSKEVGVNSGELYEFRIYSRTWGDGWHTAVVYFDDTPSISFDLPYLVFEGYYWTLFSIQGYAPDTADNAHFVFTCGNTDPGIWFNWDIDNVSVIHTATAVTPTSFGYIKAAYR